MSFKDLFSNHAGDYKKFRPKYPDAIFKYLAQLVDDHQAAWDCATGNGQGAVGLAEYFRKVYATDASAAQLTEAEKVTNIDYQVATAEDCKLSSQSVSLVTVFQAAHWFDLDKFYQEVKRVCKPQGILALVGYHTAVTGINKVDDIYKEFCYEFLVEKNCWEMNRSFLNDEYRTIQFPFTEVNAPNFMIETKWNYQDYLAYLNTWSAVKKYINLYHENPIEQFVIPNIDTIWQNKEEKIIVKFPLILRIGQV